MLSNQNRNMHTHTFLATSYQTKTVTHTRAPAAQNGHVDTKRFAQNGHVDTKRFAQNGNVDTKRFAQETHRRQYVGALSDIECTQPLNESARQRDKKIDTDQRCKAHTKLATNLANDTDRTNYRRQEITKTLPERKAITCALHSGLCMRQSGK